MKKILVLVFLSICFGTVSAQNNNVFPATGNVGIGTTNPAAKISFNEVSDSDIPSGLTWFGGAPLNYGIYRTPGAWAAPAFQQLKLSWDTGIILEPGSQYQNSYVDIKGGGLRVSSGNVGIGTATPTTKLEVSSSVDNDQLSIVKSTVEGDKGPGIVFKNLVNGGSLSEIGGIQAKLLHGGDGLIASSLSFYTKYNAAKVEAVTINPQGDMGIGTITPRENSPLMVKSAQKR